MMTYEMIGVADENGRTYESKYGTYNKEYGFKLTPESIRIDKTNLLFKLFHENCWLLKKEAKKMTIEEIQKALGYEVEIIESQNNKNSDKTKVEEIPSPHDLLYLPYLLNKKLIY